MSKAVYTRKKRFTFVEKTSAEVGAGTFFPLLVTLDQLAEIYYRVKDAKFTGSVSAAYSFATIDLTADATVAPSTDYHSGSDTTVICQRSYVDDQSPPVNTADEPKIWTQPHTLPDTPATSILPFPLSHGIATGLTHYLESFALPSSEYHCRGNITVSGTTGDGIIAAIELAFSGQVAWVDTNASGNPIDPLNSLYVGLQFQCYTNGGMVIVDAYSLQAFTSNEGASGNLTIDIATGTLTVPLFCSNHTLLASAYSSLTLTATEWWPYQAGIPSAPVWDSATGFAL